MCGATKGGLSVAGIDVTKEAVIQGRVLRGGEPVASAYVRLLDSTGEFTAEVPTSATGHFRFFAGDGNWTLRTLAPGCVGGPQRGRRAGKRGRDRRRTRSRLIARRRQGGGATLRLPALRLFECSTKDL